MTKAKTKASRTKTRTRTRTNLEIQEKRQEINTKAIDDDKDLKGKELEV